MSRRVLILILVCIFSASFGNGLFAQTPVPGIDDAGSVDVPSAPVETSLALDAASSESGLVLGEGGGGDGSVFGASAGAIIRMVLVLALAAAAIYGVVFFLRRAARPRGQNNPHLKILSSVHLGSNRFVHVISVGVQAWLVGTGEGGVTLIAEIGDQEAVDAMLLDASRRSAESAPGRFSDFRALLRRFRGGSEGVSSEEADTLSPDNLRRRRERLKGL